MPDYPPVQEGDYCPREKEKKCIGNRCKEFSSEGCKIYRKSVGPL